MKVEVLNSKVIHSVVALLKHYKEIKGDTPSEFLKEYTSLYKSKEDGANDEEAITELFLEVARHEKFLERFILQYYIKHKRIIHSDKYLLMVLCHIITFFTNREQLEMVAKVLIKTSLHKSSGLASFLSHETGVLVLIQAASCYFEQDYVKEKIAAEVLKDENLFQDLHSILKQTETEPAKEEIIVPQHIKTLANRKTARQTPTSSITEEFQEVFLEKVRRIPVSTYKKPSTEKKLQEVHEENKIKSLKNFQKAQRMPSHLTQPLRPQVLEPTPEKFPTIKAKPPPDFKEPEVPVKMNTSSVLRQAIKIVKEEEQEIKRVKDLTVGALDYTQFEKLFIELRLKDEEEYLKSIEKKHLKGLSTYEEAILAKRDYLEKNKENRALFEKQKKELEEQLKEYKKIEEEKIRQLVQKTQDIKKHADDKKRDLLNKKQKIAKEVTENSRLLMIQLLKKRTEELHKKIELIKEIRTLAAFKTRRKEFDETETMNIGLLCEMSIAELNERLAMVRAEMKEELELRQRRIKQEKIRQQELLHEMKKLIECNHVERRRITSAHPKTIKTVEPDEEILALRRKLEEAREKRKANLN